MADYGFNLHKNNQKNRRRRKTSNFIIAFVCFVIVLGSVSLLWFWRSLNYDFNNIFSNGDVSTTHSDTTIPAEDKVYSGKYTFLIAVTSDDGKESYFFNAITVDLSDKTIRVIPVDGNIKDTATRLNCYELLVDKGIKSVVKCLENHYDVIINKSAVLTETGYKNIFRTMGDITINISEEIIYDTDDMFLEIPANTDVELSSDKVYKYMKYIYETKDGYERSELAAEIIVAAFNSFYTVKNIENSDNIFSNVIDYCDTDISAVDYNEAKDELAYLLPENSKEKLKVFVSDNIRADSQEEAAYD